jgi:periplasmic protein TonB
VLLNAQPWEAAEARSAVWARAACFALGAALITIALLLMMQYLIVTGVQAVTEERTFRFVDFIRVQRDERPQTRDEKVERVQEAQAPPPMQHDRQLDERDTGGAGVGAGRMGVAAPQVSHEVSLGREGFYSDGEYMPIVQVAPMYPRRAEDLRLEGFVLLEFTVTRDGLVRDPRILESSNPIFDRPAIDAVLRFRYRPRVIDGEPLEVPGVRFRITFQMSQEVIPAS